MTSCCTMMDLRPPFAHLPYCGQAPNEAQRRHTLQGKRSTTHRNRMLEVVCCVGGIPCPLSIHSQLLIGQCPVQVGHRRLLISEQNWACKSWYSYYQ